MQLAVSIVCAFILLITTLAIPWNDGVPIYLIHIPKTAGSSFLQDLNTLKSGKSPLFEKSRHNIAEIRVISNESCYAALYHANATNVVLFRNPRDHVQSQFLEIKYDPYWGYGDPLIKQTKFPRNMPDDVGFNVWLDHFNMSTWGKTTLDDFRSMNPINMQARQMSCKSLVKEASHHIDMKLGDPIPLPLLDEAIINLATMDHVGITEFYSAFICMFIWKSFGYFAKGCDCTAGNIERLTNHVFHSVPRHSWKNLKQSTINKIDPMTEIDRVYYTVAVERFVKDIHHFQKVVNRTVLCPNVVRNAINSSLSYIDIPILRHYTMSFEH